MAKAPTIEVTPAEKQVLERLAAQEQRAAEQKERERLSDRLTLQLHYRNRELKARAAKLVAAVEREIAARYEARSDEALVDALKRLVVEAVEEAGSRIQAGARELGCSEAKLPEIEANFGRRRVGHTDSFYALKNDVLDTAPSMRRSELQTMAREHADRLLARAEQSLERRAEEMRERLSDDPWSDDAQALPDSLPSADELIPAFELAELEARERS